MRGYWIEWSRCEASLRRVKVQHASDVYKEMFGADGHSNEDIATVPPKSVPKHDLLVGGFPCQDYSVAKQLGKSKGIEGKKGVLSLHPLLHLYLMLLEPF